MKLRTREGNRNEERCAVCRDGPSGLVVCRGCGTFLHATCLIEMQGCPTLGCDERDPLQSANKKRSLGCVLHTPDLVSSEVKKDLRDLWGYDRCSCEESRRSTVGGDLKEHQAIQRAEKGPRTEPECLHRFHPLDNRCVHCHVGAEEVAARVYGSVWLDRLHRMTEKHGADVAMSSFGVTSKEAPNLRMVAVGSTRDLALREADRRAARDEKIVTMLLIALFSVGAVLLLWYIKAASGV